MSVVVRRNYPARNLPDDLKKGIDPSKDVTIMIVEEERPRQVMTFEEIFATRTSPYLTRRDIDDHIRSLREDRDDG